ncbi:zf-TFIIB domain-containing protein [Candidatus Nomurabacteria bacterium]|jgi:Zn-finger nucleic acid-binding protein|nr:zf-TFIIB domain-containing protein [Candidatus Saccharibacteria bacterium]MCB9839556.1 zf-TFIIB domain-containing protein [Candidatus Nomurabacteria bacterium]
MRCPVDNSRLTIIDRAGVELELCPDCRGVWLERDELDKIMDNVGLSSRNLIYSSGARRQDSFVSELFDF